MRWMELNAFTAVFRTHEGLDPEVSAQFDTNAETLAHLCASRRLRARGEPEGAGRGCRRARPSGGAHPFLHYPGDATAPSVRYQFLLGPDLMVAPVLDPGVERVEVYFPEGSAWTDLWAGADAGEPGEWRDMPAPLGGPAVFLRKDAPAAETILGGLREAGVLDWLGLRFRRAAAGRAGGRRRRGCGPSRRCRNRH